MKTIAECFLEYSNVKHKSAIGYSRNIPMNFDPSKLNNCDFNIRNGISLEYFSQQN